MPDLQPSNQSFRRVGNGINVSLDKTYIILTLGGVFKPEFQVGLVENDLSIIFGLEHQKKLQCSTSEVENTFTHYSTGIIIPAELKPSVTGNPEQGGCILIKWSIS